MDVDAINVECCGHGRANKASPRSNKASVAKGT